MSRGVAQLIKELKSGIETIYGQRLRGVYLFGSRARGDEDAESDLDLLIVLDSVADYFAELDRIGDLYAEKSAEHGISVSPVLISEDAWSRADTLFLFNAKREALAA